MDKEIIRQLREIVGRDNITTAKEERQCYSYDGTGMVFMPEAVVFPGGSAEVSRVMQLATRERFPVVPRGAGSGMSGGSLPLRGGVVMVMSRFDRIIEIDQDNQLAVVEPGVVTGVLQKEAKRYGLFYPPDPASLKFCTIGGNAAECAGGPSAVKYGVTRDYIKGLEVVLADGRIINTGVKTDKGVVGYDLTRLFVGSEGTLGIITKIIVRLRPKPQSRTTILLSVDNMARAASLVARLLSLFTPCILEFMDKTALAIVSDKMPFPLPKSTEALLLIELDGTEAAVVAESAAMLDFLVGKDGVLKVQQAASHAEVKKMWQARRSVSPAAFDLRPHKISEDVVVPRTRIPDLVTYTEELAAELALVIFCFGHAGDGNIHVNIMLDKDNEREAASGKIAKERLFAKVLELSGSLSGEHGVGITKSGFLEKEIGAATLEVMMMIKKNFDPDNILNPGKIFP